MATKSATSKAALLRAARQGGSQAVKDRVAARRTALDLISSGVPFDTAVRQAGLVK